MNGGGQAQVATDTDGLSPEGVAAGVNGRYAWYVLGVLCLVYTVNSMDRSLLSILAEDVKKTFSLSDSQLGFLHGTAFAIFYALFGYPVGRLADRWRRVNLLSVGLTLWSMMTALCGLSAAFGQLALFRAGVGIGEASASPAGFSLVSDWFSKTKRATALGFFVSGTFIGSGLSLLLGGLIASSWNHAFPGTKPFGLVGWRIAFLALGVPGLLLAVWVSTLREPGRGQSDGIIRPVEGRIWSRLFIDVSAVLPPLTLYSAARAGPRALLINLAAAVTAALAAWLLVRLTGDLLQWALIGFGYYAGFSASQSLRHQDRPTFALTWASPTFMFATLGFGFVSMVNIAVIFWTAPLALRTFHLDKAVVGPILGVINAVAGVLGVVLGGRLSDLLLRRTPLGRIWVGLGSTLIPVPFVFAMCTTHSPMLFFLYYAPVALVSTAWIPAGAATIQELVLPRMRGTATNIYFLFSTMVGSGLVPYLIGKISVATHSLAVGIMWGMAAAPFAVVTMWLCGRGLQRAEMSKWADAAAAGEPV